MDQKTIAINMMVTGPFPAQMAANGAAVQSFGNQANAGMAKAQTGMQRFGKSAMKVATFGALAVAAGLALSAKAAIDFESSFAGIRKTVDTSEEGFRMLAAGIREMATEIPIGVNELNRIGELGGQLGVDPGNLLAFTDTIAKIGVTTTLSTEQASLGFARIDNVMQTGGKSFDRMGSTIVDLGNNFAATEDEILTFATRIAPVGATVGLVTDEILAIATAFTSVGIPAERGGTAVQKTFIAMAEAAQQGGTELDAFAKTAGVTAEEFAAIFEEDPAEALTMFTEGMKDIIDEGGNVYAVLESVGLANERVRASLLAVANADGVLRESLELSATAWGDNTALSEEAQKRFETTASAMIILKNKVQDVAISLGTVLLPAINTFIDGGVSIIDFFSNLEGAMQAAILAVPAFIAAMAVAYAHPVVAGLGAVAALVYTVGREANAAATETDLMVEAFGRLNGQLDAETLIQYLEIGGMDGAAVAKEFDLIGLSLDTFAEAASGTDAGWAAFVENYKVRLRNIRGEEGFRFPVVKLDEVRRAWLNAGQLSIQERQRQIAEADAAEEEFLARMKERGQGSFGGGEAEPAPLIPATLSGDVLDDINDVMSDYVSVFSEAFDETDERIRGQIDLWYEFGDTIETFDAEVLLPNLMRQVDAIGEFEAYFRTANLPQVVETFLRDSFGTDPGLMEAFVAWMEDGTGTFEQFIRGVDAELGPGGELDSIIIAAFQRQLPGLEFAAGAELLAQLQAIVAEVDADPDNIYSLGEIWLATIEEALLAGGPGVAQTLYDTLVEIFGEGGIPGVDLTIEQIEELIETIMNIPVAKEVEIGVTTTYRWNNTEGGYDPVLTPSQLERLEKMAEYEGLAMGGQAIAGTPYVVGERGPELFLPFTSGTVIPNNRIGDVGGSKTTTVNVIRPETSDLAGDISEGLTRASVTEQVDLIGVY